MTPIRQLGALGYLKPHEGSTFNYKNWVVVNHQVRGKQQDVGKKVKRLEVKFHGGLKGSNTILQTFPITGFRKPYQTVLEEVNLLKIQDFWDNGRIPLQKVKL